MGHRPLYPGLMKRLARVVGFVGGALAIIWAMRDRFISVAVSREPEPPAFRGDFHDGKPLEAIQGVGPTYATRLRAAGIDDPQALSKESADKVAEAAGVSVTRARQWIEAATQV